MRRMLVLMVLILGASVSAAGRVQAAELRDLQDLDELRTLVDHDQSVPRLVLLLSPT